MANYIDSFVIPVRTDKMDDYKKLARKMGKIFIEYGALEYIETLEDDVPYGKHTSFPRSVKRQENEVLIFSYMCFKSRAQRDKINQRAFNDPRTQKIMTQMDDVLDAKRMIFGGFKSFITLRAN